MSNEFTTPTVHLNGTGAESLRAEYSRAAKALQKFNDAFNDATCNPRDFYVGKAGAWETADDERREAARCLRHLLRYVDAWNDSIEAQVDAINARKS